MISVTKLPAEDARRPYELGKRLEQMDQSRAAILRAARAQLEANGYQRFSMGSVATEAGIARQTVHNLFGTKAALLEALFDLIALEGGMDNMRIAMTQPAADAMLERFIHVFCGFWATHRVLIRRIHGIGAIDPEFGQVVDARNSRRLGIAQRILQRAGIKAGLDQRAAVLAALTSFEFYDKIADTCATTDQAAALILSLARNVLAASAIS